MKEDGKHGQLICRQLGRTDEQASEMIVAGTVGGIRMSLLASCPWSQSLPWVPPSHGAAEKEGDDTSDRRLQLHLFWTS